MRTIGRFRDVRIGQSLLGIICAVLFACALFAPMTAFAAPDSTGASENILDLSDGNYLIDVAVEGGSGKATVETPAKLEIEGGKAYVTLVWSSPHYDYMLVGNEKILPVTAEPTSQFRVPVLAFDEKYEMTGNTTAMDNPHEIAYTFYFDSKTIEEAPAPMASPRAEDEQLGIYLAITIGCLFVAALAISIAVGILRRNRQKRL